MEREEKPIKVKKKQLLNKIGDEVVVDPEKADHVKESHVLTMMERRKRSISLRKHLPKIKRARELARKRMAGKKKLGKRSRNLAKRSLRKRYAGATGAGYSTLSPSGKMAVDRMVNSKQQAITTIAKRLLPKVRRAEAARFTGGKRASASLMQSMEYDKELVESVTKMVGKDPCWTGYKMVGQKKKGGKDVPNCVPVKEEKKRPIDKLLDRLKSKRKPWPVPDHPKETK